MLQVLRLGILALTLLCVGVRGYTNPVLDGTAADPYIFLHTDGFYYYVLSTDGGIVVMKNDQIMDWRNPLERQKVYEIPEGHGNLWAPEIHNIDGEWYIYFTMGTCVFDICLIPTQRMWVIQALNKESPLGAYSHAKRLEPPSEDFYQIDGTVVQYGNSSNLYMMWSGCDVGGIDNPTNMYIAKMSDPKTISSERVLLRNRTQDWEGTVIEGPQVIWNGTRLFIIFSANHYTREDYCLGMMGIDDFKDPLIPTNWWHNLNPVFQKNIPAGVYGPGHASFTHVHCEETGEMEGWIAYHAMEIPDMGNPPVSDNRTTRVERYTWNAEGVPELPIPSALGTQLPNACSG